MAKRINFPNEDVFGNEDLEMFKQDHCQQKQNSKGKKKGKKRVIKYFYVNFNFL